MENDKNSGAGNTKPTLDLERGKSS